MKRNYKIAACVLTALAILSIVVEWLSVWSAKELSDITVIGGADGPTSIYVASKSGSGEIFIIAAVIFLAAAAAFLILSKRKK